MDAEHAAMLMALQADVTIEAIVAQAPLIGDLLRDLERTDATEKLATLLLLPEHQGNTPRLEFLVHAAFAICDGNRKLSRSRANQLFKACDDTIVSRLEDPAEDHFATPVYFQEEEFLVIEGLWESGNFYLQRILNALATAPNEGVLIQIKKQTHAFLSLSNAACQERLNGRYVAGASIPGKSIQPDAMFHPGTIRFSPSRLKELGIEKRDLAAFQFPVDERTCLLSESFAVTSLHRKPIIEHEGDLIVAIAGAVSFAIRQSFVEVANHLGNLEQLSIAIGREYERLFHSEAILGTHRHAPIDFVRAGNTLTAEVVTKIDQNTWLQLVLFADTLDGIAESSVAGPIPPNRELAELIRHQVLTQNRILEHQPDFKAGISLLVDCGVGRSVSLPITNEQSDAWTIEPITAPDLLTLSRIDELNSLRFMTMLKSRKIAEDHGLKIINPWGVATLIAWMRSNGGHIVPHRDVSQDLRGESFSLSLLPSCFRDLRLLAAEENDIRFAVRSDGTKIQVRRLRGLTFISDRKTVVYIPSRPDADGGLPYVHCTKECDWWFVSKSDGEDPNRFQHGETALTWMRRIIPVVAPTVPSTTKSAIEVRLHFPGTDILDGRDREQPLPTATEIRSEMQMTVNDGVVTVQLGKSFNSGLRAPDNRSEWALVAAVVEGLLSLRGFIPDGDQVNAMVDEIVVDQFARQMHSFSARNYRDRFAQSLTQSVVEATDQDNANLRFGLAFRAEPVLGGRRSLRSRASCTQLLNTVVESLERQLHEVLSVLDRRDVLQHAIRNYETATFRQDRWEKTAQANISLHPDDPDATEIIAKQTGRLSSAITGSRLLLEIAGTMCTISSGRQIGKIEFQEVLSLIDSIQILRGWADSIHRGAMVSVRQNYFRASFRRRARRALVLAARASDSASR